VSATPEPAPVAYSSPIIDLEGERQRAYEEGVAAGVTQMEAQIAQLESDLQVLGPVLEELASARKRALTAANQNIASLVLALASRIAGDSLALHPDALPRLVARTLERLPEEDEIWVRVPPDDVQRVTDSLGPKHKVRVIEDSKITAGCVIETRQAQIDCTLEAAMKGLDSAVRAWLESLT
jgi:flagellar biosynthesis/type III secretory pathway protein FliH